MSLEEALPPGTVAIICVTEAEPGQLALVPMAWGSGDGPDLTRAGPYVGQWIQDNGDAVLLMSTSAWRAHMDAVRARSMAKAAPPSLALVSPDGSKLINSPSIEVAITPLDT